LITAASSTASPLGPGVASMGSRPRVSWHARAVALRQQTKENYKPQVSETTGSCCGVHFSWHAGGCFQTFRVAN
jgi:hypothetical protein